MRCRCGWATSPHSGCRRPHRRAPPAAEYRRARLEHPAQVLRCATHGQRGAIRHQRVEDLPAVAVGQDVAVHDLEPFRFPCTLMEACEVPANQVGRSRQHLHASFDAGQLAVENGGEVAGQEDGPPTPPPAPGKYR
ncbi:hypothetical protein G6F65_021587 [Rhizopus arrhizus]|nr:hypothetical protein G6F65_021587 [Rhizopus arrhizus]